MVEQITSVLNFYKVGKEVKEHSYPVGEFIGLNKDALEIACDGGILKVYECQLEGKKRMDARSFMNGVGKELIGKVFS